MSDKLHSTVLILILLINVHLTGVIEATYLWKCIFFLNTLCTLYPNMLWKISVLQISHFSIAVLAQHMSGQRTFLFRFVWTILTLKLWILAALITLVTRQCVLVFVSSSTCVALVDFGSTVQFALTLIPFVPSQTVLGFVYLSTLIALMCDLF